MSGFAHPEASGTWVRPAPRRSPAILAALPRAGRLARLGPAAITFCAILAAGAVLAALDARTALHESRARAAESAGRTLTIVRASAAEAAWQLNADLARRVVVGLMTDEAVASAVLADNFGQVLAQEAQVRVPDPAAPGASLFAGTTTYEVPLWYPRADGAADRVGTLTLRLAPDVLGGRFVSDAAGGAARGMLRLVVLALAGLGLMTLLARRGVSAR